MLSKKDDILILPVRNPEKVVNAVKEIKQRFPNASIEVMPMDISDLYSVRQFAEKFKMKI